jgi:large subunit ribosomal protein L19
MNITKLSKTKVSSNMDLIKYVEEKYLSTQEKKEKALIEIGDLIRIGYSISEGDKERVQYYEGLVIAINNRGLGKSFVLRRTVQGIGVEQIFVFNSPKLLSIVKKQSSKVRRSKLYYIRNLRGKATNLKIKL